MEARGYNVGFIHELVAKYNIASDLCSIPLQKESQGLGVARLLHCFVLLPLQTESSASHSVAVSIAEKSFI